MESFKLCEIKSGYIWNVLTGKDTELINEVHGLNVSLCSKLSEIVFLLAERL
jgi:hypothetical protein